MNTIHVLFRREFGLMPLLVQSVAPGDAGRAQVIADHLRFMSDLLHHHHQAEDAVLWPLLLDRAPGETRLVVHLAENHHERIDGLLDQAGQLLEVWADGLAAGARDALALALRQLAVVLFEHMSIEEQLVLPVVAQHVLRAEWEAMEQKSVAANDSRDITLLFGMALYEGGPEIVPERLRADMLAIAPEVYADYAERVHGTRTPPRATDIIIGTPAVSVRLPAGSALPGKRVHRR